MRRQRKQSSNRSNPTETSAESTVRIIGGSWRGRKLPVAELEGLRPTPDRVRETLFNWLQSVTPGARCLDLFAGSGALGLEALSRGAASVTLVDQSPWVCNTLRQNVQMLKAQAAEIIQADATAWLENQPADLGERFDLVFLDPPFHKNLVPVMAEQLTQRNLLAQDARIYVETEKELGMPWVPNSWSLRREKSAGQVSYRLFDFEP